MPAPIHGEAGILTLSRLLGSKIRAGRRRGVNHAHHSCLAVKTAVESKLVLTRSVSEGELPLSTVEEKIFDE